MEEAVTRARRWSPGLFQESSGEAIAAVSWSRRVLQTAGMPGLPPYLGYRESGAADIAGSKGHATPLRQAAMATFLKQLWS